MNPLSHPLAIVRWQLFATLTFKKEKSEPVAMRILFAWLRTAAGYAGIHFKRLLWVVRAERGEIGLRYHLHVLLAGLPPTWLRPASIFAVKNVWERLGGGMARVRLFSHDLAGVDYVLKGLVEAEEAAFQGASLYEFSKFGRCPQLMLSESVCRYVHAAKLGAERDGRQAAVGRNSPERYERHAATCGVCGPQPGAAVGLTTRT